LHFHDHENWMCYYVYLYGLLISCFENYIYSYQFIIFNESFRTIKKFPLINTYYFLFQHQFFKTLKHTMSN